jgi:hypothetical protein
MGGECSTLEEIRNAYITLVRKPERERLLGRPRWEDYFKMGLREIGLYGVY